LRGGAKQTPSGGIQMRDAAVMENEYAVGRQLNEVAITVSSLVHNRLRTAQRTSLAQFCDAGALQQVLPRADSVRVVNPLDASPLRWVVLAAGIVMAAYAWQTRHPNTSSDFTILYNSALRPPALMYQRPPGPPRGNLNPPHFQLLIVPLTWLPLPVAAAVWRTLNVLALAACVWWLARHSGEKWGAADIGALLAWSPMQSALGLNQLTWIMWPLLVWTWWCWRQDRWTAGAITYGLALSFKSFLGVFLVWLALRRQWRAIATALATAVAALAVGVLVYGVDVFRAWLAGVAGVEWSYAVMNASLRGFLARTLTTSGTAGAPPALRPGLVTPLFLAGAALILVVTFVRTRRASVDESWPALLAGSLLASPLGWLYYIWWMLPGTRPSHVLFAAPLLWVPMVCAMWGQPSPWATLTIGSVFFWGLLVAWLGFVRNGIGRVGPVDTRQVVERDAYSPAIR
jgi:hypothetical protein